jgi:membrane-associated protein
MILRLLDPILNLHGLEAYALVGAFVFAEAAILIGFIFPGETAVILGGVVASRGHINIVALVVVVVLCAIAGDSVGYVVGQRWGQRLLDVRLLRRRRRLIDRIADQLNRRGGIAVFVARFTAFLRAVVPGLAGMSAMPYRVFLPANARRGCRLGHRLLPAGLFRGQCLRAIGEHLEPGLRHPPRPHRRGHRGAVRPGKAQGEGPSWPRLMPQPTTRRSPTTQAELSRPPLRAPTGHRRAGRGRCG